MVGFESVLLRSEVPEGKVLRPMIDSSISNNFLTMGIWFKIISAEIYGAPTNYVKRKREKDFWWWKLET